MQDAHVLRILRMTRCRCTAPLRHDGSCPYGCAAFTISSGQIKLEEARTQRRNKVASKTRGEFLSREDARVGERSFFSKRKP